MLPVQGANPWSGNEIPHAAAKSSRATAKTRCKQITKKKKKKKKERKKKRERENIKKKIEKNKTETTTTTNYVFDANVNVFSPKLFLNFWLLQPATDLSS